MTEKAKLILESEEKYQKAKQKRIALENNERLQKILDKRLEQYESEAAKAFIKINKEKNKK